MKQLILQAGNVQTIAKRNMIRVKRPGPPVQGYRVISPIMVNLTAMHLLNICF
jgi:hypothetical protein